MADTQKLFGLKDECAKSLEKVTKLQCQFGVEDDSDDERGNGSDDNDNDGDEVTEALIEREMLLSDSGEWRCFYSKHLSYHCLFKMCGVSKQVSFTLIVWGLVTQSLEPGAHVKKRLTVKK